MIISSNPRTNNIKTFLQNKFTYTSKFSYTEIQTLQSKYGKNRTITIALALVYLFAAAFVYTWLLYAGYRLIHGGSGAGAEVFYPSGILVFSLNGILLALTTMSGFIDIAQRIMLGANYEEFKDYYKAVEGYDNQKAGRFFSMLFGIVCLLSMCFTFPSRIVLKEQGITIATIFQPLAKDYNYTDISQIAFYEKFRDKQGNVTDSPHYMLFFADGNTFRPAFYFSDGEGVKAFVDKLSFYSHIPVTNAGTDVYK